MVCCGRSLLFLSDVSLAIVPYLSVFCLYVISSNVFLSCISHQRDFYKYAHHVARPLGALQPRELLRAFVHLQARRLLRPALFNRAYDWIEGAGDDRRSESQHAGPVVADPSRFQLSIRESRRFRFTIRSTSALGNPFPLSFRLIIIFHPVRGCVFSASFCPRSLERMKCAAPTSLITFAMSAKDTRRQLRRKASRTADRWMSFRKQYIDERAHRDGLLHVIERHPRTSAIAWVTTISSRLAFRPLDHREPIPRAATARSRRQILARPMIFSTSSISGNTLPPAAPEPFRRAP